MIYINHPFPLVSFFYFCQNFPLLSLNWESNTKSYKSKSLHREVIHLSKHINLHLFFFLSKDFLKILRMASKKEKKTMSPKDILVSDLKLKSLVKDLQPLE